MAKRRGVGKTRVSGNTLGQPDTLFDRDGLYGTTYGAFEDNAERFMYLAKAVPEVLKAVGFKPDVLHVNDWQTGLTPVALRRGFHGWMLDWANRNKEHYENRYAFLYPLYNIFFDLRVVK